MQILNMRKILLFIPILLFGNSLMHPDDPKSRNHNSLGFGVTGDVVISDGVFYVGQTGSSLNNGSVYIYTPNGSNGFDQKNIMAPIDEELGFDFGYSIDVNGDLMLIGAPHRTDLVGRAYLYQKDYKDRWQLIEIISPSSENWTSDFGSQVKINEQHILIADQKFNQEKGSVFTMKLNLNTDRWELGNILSYEKMNQDGFFGYSMALNSDRAVIGSRNGNIAVEYQFDKTSGEWLQKQIFSPYQFQSKGRYGYAVDMNSEYLIIGSPGYDELGFTEIHQLVNDDWKKVYSISNPENIKESFFGSSVTIDNDHLIIGNYNGEKSQVYQIDDGTFQLKQTLNPPNDKHDGKFGRTLDVENNYLIVGATYAERAHIYKINDKGWDRISSVSSDQQTNSVFGKKVPCENDKSGNFKCNSIDMLSFLNPKDLSGGINTELNDLWGWTDSSTGKEYGLIGLRNGTSFVDISDPINPFVVGFLPTATSSATWRDMKVYKDHVFIVADGAGDHGVQVFDLTQLRGVTSFTEFKMTFHYQNLGSVHNIALNEETGYAYATGISSAPSSDYKCGGGLHMLDLTNPAEPQFAGCFSHEGTGRSGTGYTHDAQIVVYNGPDTEYVGKEIAFSSNETALSIGDVTDKKNVRIISKFDNANFGYVHQGWLTEDHRYFFVNDELNEYRGNDNEQTTVIFDLEDLDNPKILKIYRSGLNTIDHNNYVKGNLLFQSNYSTGLRVLFIDDVSNPVEVAHFDTYSAGDKVSFVGSWSNYPYFKSGSIIVSSIEEGLFILKASESGNLSISNNQIPEKFELKQNYPNPFNPTTQIQYFLPKSINISLVLYNTLGVEVMKLDTGYRSSGSHTVNMDASGLPTGIYFYQLRAGDFVQTRKMSLIK